MATDLESEVSLQEQAEEKPGSGWLRMSAVAAASALVGGLAAAWYYRKTLARLQEAEEREAAAPIHPEYDSGDET